MPLLDAARGNTQGVSATSAGRRLLDHARRIIAMSEAAFQDLQDRSLDGELRIAITDYYRPHDIAHSQPVLRTAPAPEAACHRAAERRHRQPGG
jgi:DNA-binding transcriptional LysR family regulator